MWKSVTDRLTDGQSDSLLKTKTLEHFELSFLFNKQKKSGEVYTFIYNMKFWGLIDKHLTLIMMKKTLPVKNNSNCKLHFMKWINCVSIFLILAYMYDVNKLKTAWFMHGHILAWHFEAYFSVISSSMTLLRSKYLISQAFLREAAKKVLFFSGQSTKAFSPHPSA